MKPSAKGLLVWTGALYAASALLPAGAEEAGTGQAPEAAAAAASPLTGDVELGAGYVSDDSFAFGRYSGLEGAGGYPVGAFNLRFRPGLRTDYLRLTGSDLGTEARSISLKYGTQGSYDIFVGYDQLPSFKIDSAQTPFVGVGTGDLNLTPQFRAFDVETERKGLAAGIAYHPAPHLTLSLLARRETKEGVDVIGGALGRNPGGSGGGGGATGFSNPYAALLPEPVDYVDNQFDIKLGYVRQQYQWELAYHASLFENDNASLQWDNPAAIGGSDTPPPGQGQGPGQGAGQGNSLVAAGRLALPPSNQFHQLTLNGAYSLSDTTRLTGLLSTGVMLQDENFLPYRVGDTTAGLPRTSLDGEVYVHAARLGLTGRPLPALRLSADYRYDERDNQTPQTSYDYFRLDTNVQPGAVTNQPLSYRKHRLDVDARYRFDPRVSAGLEYGYRNIRRDFSDVEENQEHEVQGRLQFKPIERLDLSLKAGRMERTASDYQAESPGQNPLLRKYYLADETRDKVGLAASYQPHETLSVGLSADWVRDDYDETAIGLSEGERRSYTLDLSYLPRPDLVLYGFYTRDRLESTQLGSSDGALAANWRAAFDDAIDTLGVGAKITDLKGKLDLGVDYVYMAGDGDIDLAHATINTVSQFPTLQNELQSIRLYALYRLKPEVELKLSYLREEFDSTDWALDGYSVDSVPNALLLGNTSPDYDEDLIIASVRYRF